MINARSGGGGMKALLFAALHALLLAGCEAADAKHAAKLLMIEELRTALSNRDVFAHLSKDIRRAWEYHDGRSINETLESFKDIPVDITVAIKLVGFDGDGVNQVRVSEPELLRYLRALHMDVRTAVLEPELAQLSLRPRLHFRVSKADIGLTHRVASVLTSAVFQAKQASARPNPGTLYIPHSLVDDVLAAEEERAAGPAPPGGRAPPPHHHGTSALAALTLYVLNLEPPSGSDYLYAFGERPELVAAGNWSAFSSCPGALHVSALHQAQGGEAHRRTPAYAWVDLAAGPHSYGPLRGGHGQVFPHSLPHAGSFQPALVHTAILPELAALAASAVQHLAWPPLQHARLGALDKLRGQAAAEHGAELEVQLVHIHDTLAVPHRSVDAVALQAELSAAVSGSALRVRVKESYLSFALCDLCVTAYANALRVSTQRQEGSSVVATAGQILDRLVLHRALKEYSEIILAYAGVHETAGVLPVFIFDLSVRDAPLLLDGALQAAAFPDLVVAVASRAASVRTRFSCGHMARFLPAGDVTRAVLGGVLQTAFGLTHSALRFHAVSGPGWNYLWSLGATPFGPLSALATVNAAQATTVLRNLAAVELDRQAGRIAAVLHGMSRLSPRGTWPAAVPRKDHRDRLHARLNLAALKLELAVAALAEGRGGDALRLAQLVGPDAAALERLALTLEARLLQRMQCVGGTEWTALLWPPAGSLLAVGAALWWRSRGARLRAEARYDKIY